MFPKLALGPVVAVGLYAALGHATASGDLSEAGRRVIAVASLMAVWWIVEAIPLYVTALLPVLLFPILHVSTARDAAAPYADDLIFLFLGGFLLGRAFEASGLHKRVSLSVILLVGTRRPMLVLGVMLAAWAMSMWVSNTATTMMMLPVCISLVALTGEREPAGGESGSHFSVAVMLGAAYAASIGGMATPVGSPPNLVLVANLSKTDPIGFVQWMRAALPVSAVLLVLAWLLLTRVLHPVRGPLMEGGRRVIREQVAALGRIGPAEIVTLCVFVVTVTGWIFRVPIARAAGLVAEATEPGGPEVVLLKDSAVAVAAIFLLYIIPAKLAPFTPVLRPSDVRRLPWEVLLLFGGGLAMAEGMRTTGVDTYLGGLFGALGGLHPVVMLLVLVPAVVMLSELASNTAIASALVPVLIAAAPAMGLDPLPLLLPVILANSCSFMLPVATPPNAIVYASGRVAQRQMIRAGMVLNVVASGTIVLAFYLFGPFLTGRDLKAGAEPTEAPPGSAYVPRVLPKSSM